MPDLLYIFSRWWKTIVGLTVLATVVAFAVALVSPKKYLSVVTALPANTVNADKARIFNQNIESLYSVFGDEEELDKIESTAAADTIFIAAVKELNLQNYYHFQQDHEGLMHAVWKLQKNTRISKSEHGELKIRVWDEDPVLAATIANTLFSKLQSLLQHLQDQTSAMTLQKLRDEYSITEARINALSDSVSGPTSRGNDVISAKQNALTSQLQQFETLIAQYQVAVKSSPPVLLLVENARPPIKADKPRIGQVALLTFFASLVTSVLVALYLESRKRDRLLQ